jgi:hypothetical protein
MVWDFTSSYILWIQGNAVLPKVSRGAQSLSAQRHFRGESGAGHPNFLGGSLRIVLVVIPSSSKGGSASGGKEGIHASDFEAWILASARTTEMVEEGKYIYCFSSSLIVCMSGSTFIIWFRHRFRAACGKASYRAPHELGGNVILSPSPKFSVSLVVIR